MAPKRYELSEKQWVRISPLIAGKATDPGRTATPSHDHLVDIFASVDAKQFQRCFVAWVAALTGAPAEVMAIDGKTSRITNNLTDS